MTENTLYVGLDTDKKGIDVAVAEPLPGGEVRYVGKIANDAVSLDRTLKRLAKGGRELMVCYEAGPCGYGIYRRLNGRPGVRCQVIAPSLMPRQPGNRVKTNRRDALTLARLLRAEELTAIWVPDAEHEAMRDLVRETVVRPADLVLPLFVVPGRGVRRDVGSMPGVAQTSVDELVRDAEEALRLGIRAVLLFGVPAEKDEVGSSGYAEDGVVQEAVRALKRELPELVVITDVCLCEYTSHGHCGVLRGDEVDNDATLPLLARMAALAADLSRLDDDLANAAVSDPKSLEGLTRARAKAQADLGAAETAWMQAEEALAEVTG